MNATISQSTAIQPGSVVAGNTQKPLGKDAPSPGGLEGVQYVKDALSSNPEKLTDAELNALAHMITQVTASFSIQQSFTANVSAFANLEKTLEALEELLKDVKKAKQELKDGMKTIILSELLSAVLGGLVAGKASLTAIRQLRHTKFSNNVHNSLNQRSSELDVRVYSKKPSAGEPAPAPTPKEGAAPTTKPAAVEMKDKPAAKDSIDAKWSESVRRDKSADEKAEVERSAKAELEKRMNKLQSDAQDTGKWNWNPYKSATEDSKYLSNLPKGKELSMLDEKQIRPLADYSRAKAESLANVVQLEMHAARLVQQFTQAFKTLGETEQNLAQLDINANNNVYSNVTEYWSTLMGTLQNLSQEYQGAFQSDMGALDQDVAQANMMAQYIYR